jgi:hypothetical protein
MIEREQSTDFDPSMIPHHLEIAALTGGPKSARYLRELLFRQPALKNKIIKALKEAGYESPGNEHGQILDLAASLFDEANSIIGLRNSVNGEQTQIVSNALLIELQAREEALFYLFSFIYSRQKILSALDNIRSGNKERMANGAEVLDLTIPKKLCSPLLSLVEYIAGTEPLTSKKVAGPDLMIAMKNLLNRAELSLSAWTRSITIYTMYQMNPKADYSFLQVIPGQADQIFERNKELCACKKSAKRKCCLLKKCCC